MYINKANDTLIPYWIFEIKDILINKIVLYCNVTVTGSRGLWHF